MATDVATSGVEEPTESDWRSLGWEQGRNRSLRGWLRIIDDLGYSLHRKDPCRKRSSERFQDGMVPS